MHQIENWADSLSFLSKSEGKGDEDRETTRIQGGREMMKNRPEHDFQRKRGTKSRINEQQER
jgi:hypothetical protein